MGRFAANRVAVLLCLAFGLAAAPLAAQESAKGELLVGGEKAGITHAYAYADKNFSTGEDTVVVVLTDAPLPADAVQDEVARKKLVAAGTLHYVEVLLDAKKQALHYEVQHQRFGMMMEPGGGDGDHVVEVKTFDGKTVAGRARTMSAQQSLDDVPYAYDITFTAPVAPRKEQ